MIFFSKQDFLGIGDLRAPVKSEMNIVRPSSGRDRAKGMSEPIGGRPAESQGVIVDVTSVALDVGYSGTSAFVAMFKKAIGATPGAYARRGQS